MKIKKAIEISDAKIQFVSLVDKAANQKQFLITKAEGGQAQFSTYGRILKVDDDTHYITGVVYEPMVEDAQGNYMTEDEIRKAAYWFAKNGDQVDIQHSFEAVDNVAVVENYIALCNMEIGEDLIAKGSWVLTVEVQDPAIWEAVQKEEITGFSMGGMGKYSEEDVDLSTVDKAVDPAAQDDKKSVLKRLAGFLGLDVVEKGAMLETYEKETQRSNFWNALYALEDVLYRYNWSSDHYEFESNEAVVREALEEFSTVMTAVLTQKSIVKSLADGAPLKKSGEKLGAAYQVLADLRNEMMGAGKTGADIEKGDTDMKKNEVQEMIDAAVAKALEAHSSPPATQTEDPPPAEPAADVSTEAIQKMIDDSVEKAVAPFLQARGLPSNLNDMEQVQKADSVFDGLFV